MLQYPHLLNLVVISFLAAAAISDLKKREVPNWVNYGLATFGLGFALLHSLAAADWRFFAFSIAGAAAALAFAALMFYTGQWGGGDSKLLLAMGAALGLSFSKESPFISIENGIISFFFNLMIVSIFYALITAFFLSLRKRRQVAAAFMKQFRSRLLTARLAMASSVAGIIAAVTANDPFLRLGLLAVSAALAFSLFLSLLAKAVESVFMLKTVSPLKLTEGDWIAKDVVIGGKRICGPKDLGVEKSQIRQLVALYRKKKIRSVLIKEGIPFAPTFLIAYLINVFFGNVFLALLR